MRVLIANDSNFMLVQLQQMLVSLEDVKVVRSFHNGTSALTALLELNPNKYTT